MCVCEWKLNAFLGHNKCIHTKFKSIVFIARNTAFIEFPFETLFKYAACCLKHVFFAFISRSHIFVRMCARVFASRRFSRFGKRWFSMLHRYWFVHTSHCARMRKLKSNEMCIKLGKIHRFQSGWCGGFYTVLHTEWRFTLAANEIGANELDGEKEREHRRRIEMKQDLLMNVIIL